ncbi:phosphotransferase [Lysinibacter sp. HNR]|uniref:phosphotransferase enzyme family protein n=1 Tax=Lysinibacter sp. HNR TaxID=3031408 RepID=UPI002434B5D4|nr:phosphotransferase [Lysinibacter sp. HNR]WGD37457.1 phosphotransferase [Lysinibacter sp. HNR]
MNTVDLVSAEELTREALHSYDVHPEAPLTLLKNRENFVFSLRHQGRGFVVRLHRRGYHSDAELSCELDFVEALHSQGVAVPRFLRTRSGHTFCTVGTSHPAGLHQVDVQKLITNSGNFGDERTGVFGTATLDPADFLALGALTAQAHHATERSGYTLTTPRQAWDLEGLVGANPVWGDPLRLPELQSEGRRIVECAIEHIRAVLLAYGQQPHRYGPIHADLTPENILRTSSGLVLIDFDDFAPGWHLFDLATALYFYTPHPRYPDYHNALFRGYHAVRPLDAADHAAFPAILLARGLTYLGWAADRRGEETAEFHATTLLPHIVHLSRKLISRGE